MLFQTDCWNTALLRKRVRPWLLSSTRKSVCDRQLTFHSQWACQTCFGCPSIWSGWEIRNELSSRTEDWQSLKRNRPKGPSRKIGSRDSGSVVKVAVDSSFNCWMKHWSEPRWFDCSSLAFHWTCLSSCLRAWIESSLGTLSWPPGPRTNSRYRFDRHSWIGSKHVEPRCFAWTDLEWKFPATCDVPQWARQRRKEKSRTAHWHVLKCLSF